MSDAAIDFRLLGALEVVAGGRSVPLGGGRQRSLLALLLLQPNTEVGLDRIVDTLWEEPPRSVRQQIHNTTTQLRSIVSRNFTDAALVTIHGGYRFDVQKDRVDLFRFRDYVHEAAALEAKGFLADTERTLRRALDLWRGPALTGLGNERLAIVASGLDEQRLTAVEQLINVRLQRGESTSLVGELVALVAEHPLREALRAGLMTALVRAGRQADSLAVFDEGRRILADELGLDPSPELRMLQQQVLRGSVTPDSAGGDHSGPITVESAHTTKPAVGDSRRYLPRDSYEFTGRSEEIAKLAALARRDVSAPMVISAIDGMGGVGKTALAIHVCHTLGADYPDGHYFVDMQGFSMGVEPLSPARALQIVLRQCGVPAEQISADLDERSALWRSRMAGQRAILLIDNAVDVAQIRDLLPETTHTLILITTRQRFTALEGAVPLSLGTLPTADAIELFLRVAGPDREVADLDALTKVVELCGCLPLAVRIAAARFRERGSWSINQLVEKLAVQHQRGRLLAANDRDVLAVLALSYRYLSPLQRRVFRLLSLHPGSDFEAHAVAALSRIDTETAEAVLDDLFAHNLLLQREPGRYRFHDLVRDCAHELMTTHETESEQRAALTQLIDHYLQSARAWCRHAARPPFRFVADGAPATNSVKEAQNAADAIANLATEHVNFLAVITRAREAGHSDLAWRLTCALQPYLSELDHVRVTVELFEQALDDAQATGDPSGAQICVAGLALAHLEQGAVTHAQALVWDALESGVADPETRLSLLSTMARAQIRRGQFEDARASLVSARAIAEELEEWESLAVLINNLGVVLRDLGEFEQAAFHFEQVTQAGIAGVTPQLRAWALNNLAHVRYLQGFLPLALDGFHASLAASRDVNSRLGEAWSLIGLCSTYRAAGDYDTALARGREALEVAQDVGMTEAECDAFSAIGDVHLSTSSLGQAADSYEKAAELAREHDLIRDRSRAYEGLAHVHLYRGDAAGARRMWELAVDGYGPTEAENARRHLAGWDVGPAPVATCRRCDTARPESHD